MVSGASLSVAIGRHEHAVVVALAGDLEGSAVSGLGRLLEDLIDGQGNLEVVIDGRGLGRADVMGTGILAAAAERARRHGGSFMVVPSDSVREAVVDAGVAVLRNPPAAPASVADSPSSAPEMGSRVQECEQAMIGPTKPAARRATGAGKFTGLDVCVQSTVDDRVVVAVAGEIDAATAGYLRQRLLTLVGAEQRQFVIDLADVSFMDSIGIATFAWFHRRLAKTGGGQVILRSPRPSVDKILVLSGLSRVVPVVRT